MSEDTNPSVGRSQLRAEAAAWFARMRGPEAGLHHVAFEQWLARGALHRRAYNRISEIFSAGKLLKEPPAPSKRWSTPLLIGAALLLAAGLALATIVRTLPYEPAARASDDGAQFVSVTGQLRRIALSDGSIVTLDSDSLVTVRFDAGTRLLQLERGRARFDVKHERRRFVVIAGDTRVTARGTVFDVRFRTPDAIDVDLLRGAVEVVRTPVEKSAAARVDRIVLQAGQTIASRADGTLSPPAPRLEAPSWTSRLLAFDRTPLADVMAQANRYSVDKIVASDGEIAALRLSGTLRVGETGQLAERLATLFDLDVDTRAPGRIVLRRRTQK
ncbi:FecR domain-containing protein [Sphingomonas sp. SUN019]|uniref:FecR family protein n=1 Tax=Sphingomonas sp. SUN019 TaxID=2937788 RepID=UPI0021648DD0|nr:FecR domain-containing protein [Sphingomonas sp. SUN019]UVO50151.1 FecR domain-containing protein [Sphingomonas sp. SUN019]